MLLQLVFEFAYLHLPFSDEYAVVDVNDDDGDHGSCYKMEYTRAVITSLEADFGHEFADNVLPHDTSLFEAVECLDEASYEMFLTRDCEPGRLTHVDSFV